MTAPDAHHRLQVMLALLTVYAVWGSSYLATKILVSAEPPLLAAGLRFVLAGLLLGAFAWWRSGPPIIRTTELRHLAVMAAGGVVISNGLNVLGMQHVASNVVALLNATPALIIGWLGTFGRRATPLTGPARAGLGLGLLGVLLVLDRGDGFTQGSTLGWQLAILAGCAVWSLAIVYFRNATLANTPIMFLALQMIAGGAALLVMAVLAGEPLAMQWTTEGTVAFLWLTLMSSCLAYSAFTFLALNTTPVLVGSYAFVNPCVAALLGWLVLGENLGPGQVAGMAVILIAVALASGYTERLVRLAERWTKS